MARTATATQSKAKKPTRKRRKKVEPSSRGLSASDVGAQMPADGQALADAVRSDGGSALAIYREPLGGHTVVLASLPVDKVEPTPYQRDLSEPHVKRLANAMERVALLSSAAQTEIRAQDLPLSPQGSTPRASVGSQVTLAELERHHIEAVLSQSNWHQGRAAKTLGISSKTLYRKIREYGLARPKKG